MSGFWDTVQGVAAKAPITNWFVQDPSVQAQHDTMGDVASGYQNQRVVTQDAYTNMLNAAKGEFGNYGQSMGGMYDPGQAQTFGHAAAGGGDLVRGVNGMSQLAPGAGEQYFNNQQNRFGQGGQGADYWNQTQQQYAQGPSSQYWNSVAGGASTELASEGAFRNGSQLQNPSAIQNYAGQNLAQFNQPWEASGALRHGQEVLAGPSMTQQYAAQHLGQFNQPTFAQQYLGQISGQLQQQPRNAQMAFDQFQQTAPGSMDEFYDRAMQKAGQGINRGLAASGLLGSSYGANQVTDAMAGLAAQQAQDEAQYGLQRAQIAGSLAQGADTGAQNYWRTGADLAMGADSARLQQLLGGVSAASAASGDELSRALGLGTLAGSADERALAGLLGGADVASQVSNDALARTLGYGSLANNMDQASLASLLGYGSLATSADNSALARLVAGQQSSLGIDQQNLAQALGGMGAATTAQGLRDSRLQGMLDNQWQQGAGMAGFDVGIGTAGINADQELLDAYYAALMGQSQQDVNANNYTYMGKAAQDFGYLGDIMTLGQGDKGGTGDAGMLAKLMGGA